MSVCVCVRERERDELSGCMTESTHWKLSVLAAGASVAACTSTGRALSRYHGPGDAQRAIAVQPEIDESNHPSPSPTLFLASVNPPLLLSFLFLFSPHFRSRSKQTIERKRRENFHLKSGAGISKSFHPLPSLRRLVVVVVVTVVTVVCCCCCCCCRR